MVRRGESRQDRGAGQLRLALTLAALCGLILPAAAFELPPPGGGYDSQLGGAYPPPTGVIIVSRDREAAPAPGLYNICYVNAFQTQPQETAWWRANHPDLLLPLEDPNWPGEFFLDISTPEKREALAAITGEWIKGCARDGFHAIEADNLDTYTRSNGSLTEADALAYARLLTTIAHQSGLAFGQKNAAELLEHAKAAGFDFAITESCQVYSECEAYTAVHGARVLEIEYTDTARQFFDAACAARGTTASVILRDRNLIPAGAPGHVFEKC